MTVPKVVKSGRGRGSTHRAILLGAAAAALIEQFFWVLLIPAVLVGVVAVYWRK